MRPLWARSQPARSSRVRAEQKTSFVQFARPFERGGMSKFSTTHTSDRDE